MAGGAIRLFSRHLEALILRIGRLLFRWTLRRLLSFFVLILLLLFIFVLLILLLLVISISAVSLAATLLCIATSFTSFGAATVTSFGATSVTIFGAASVSLLRGGVCPIFLIVGFASFLFGVLFGGRILFTRFGNVFTSGASHGFGIALLGLAEISKQLFIIF